MTKFESVLYKISVPNMANDLDLAKSTIYRWRRGLARPDPQRAVAIIAWLSNKNFDLDFNDIYTTECVVNGKD